MTETLRHIEGTFKGHGDVELYHRWWRTPGEPVAVVIIIHGYGEHSGRYANVIEHFVPRGFDVFAFDHRGHGRSPGRRGHVDSWTQYREDVRAYVALVQTRRLGAPLFLFGHSLGGLVALDYVLHYPDGLCGVVASAPALGRIGVNPALVLLSRVLAPIWPTFSRSAGIGGEGLSRDAEVAAQFRDDPLVHGTASARFGSEMMLAIERVHRRAPDLEVPLLIIHGTADRVVAPLASKEFFERVSFADKERWELEGGYHEPHNDTDREKVLNEVEEWLRRHISAGWRVRKESQEWKQ